jgi:hypothetical protein
MSTIRSLFLDASVYGVFKINAMFKIHIEYELKPAIIYMVM